MLSKETAAPVRAQADAFVLSSKCVHTVNATGKRVITSRHAQAKHEYSVLPSSLACRRGNRRPRQPVVVCSSTLPTAEPGKVKLGFVGIGIMGLAMVST